MLLRSKDGSVAATGSILPGKTIHRHQLHEDSLIVAVDEVFQVGAQPLFEEPFNEELCKGDC